MAYAQLISENYKFKLSYNQRVNAALNQSILEFTSIQVLALGGADPLNAVIFNGGWQCNGEDIASAPAGSDNIFCVIAETDTWYNMTVVNGFNPITVNHDVNGNAEITISAEFDVFINGAQIDEVITASMFPLASIADAAGGDAAYTGNIGATYYSGVESNIEIIIPEVSGMTMNSNCIAINGEVLGMVTEFKEGRLSDKVVNKSLDGSIYIQTLGIGSNQADVKVFARTMTAKRALDAAACEGAACVVIYKGANYVGYIEGDIAWNPAIGGKVAEGTFTLLIPST